MLSVLNFILSYRLLKFPACCGLFMMNEKSFSETPGCEHEKQAQK
jgi:hypothetical protein